MLLLFSRLKEPVTWVGAAALCIQTISIQFQLFLLFINVWFCLVFSVSVYEISSEISFIFKLNVFSAVKNICHHFRWVCNSVGLKECVVAKNSDKVIFSLLLVLERSTFECNCRKRLWFIFFRVIYGLTTTLVVSLWSRAHLWSALFRVPSLLVLNRALLLSPIHLSAPFSQGSVALLKLQLLIFALFMFHNDSKVFTLLTQIHMWRISFRAY